MILLVVDMQKGIADEELYAYDSFMEKTASLIETARKNNVEVVYVRHDAGEGSGMTAGDEDFEIVGAVAPRAGEKVFDKTINSGAAGGQAPDDHRAADELVHRRHGEVRLRAGI